MIAFVARDVLQRRLEAEQWRDSRAECRTDRKGKEERRRERRQGNEGEGTQERDREQERGTE